MSGMGEWGEIQDSGVVQTSLGAGVPNLEIVAWTVTSSGAAAEGSTDAVETGVTVAAGGSVYSVIT